MSRHMHLNSTKCTTLIWLVMFLNLWFCMCNVDASNGLYDFIGYRTPPCKSYCLTTLFVIMISSDKVYDKVCKKKSFIIKMCNSCEDRSCPRFCN